MTEPEKLAAEIVGQYATIPLEIGDRLIAEVATALRAAKDEGLEEAAVIAGAPPRHTASMTQERDWAERLCPRIASAIRSKKDSGNG